MLTVVDAQLERQVQVYCLRYTCEHCAHFAPESRGCAEGFPNEPHVDRPLGGVATISFCKSFELV